MAQTLKSYPVDVEFEVIEFRVRARNKAEAHKKALAKINKMKPSSLIKKSWPGRGRELNIGDGEYVF